MAWNVGHNIYNHTDHLGNIRQNITCENGRLTVLREHNYYPFGLLHRGYNEEKEDLKYDKEQDFIFTVQAQAGRYKYKFQGQERQEDLDLGWDSFKYRNYDYAIGRFFNVDPLAGEYVHWSPYVFSGNRLIDSRELEGLEPHSIHKTLDDAAINFGQFYNGRSIINKKEYGTRLYSVIKNGKKMYSYVEPNEGSESGVFIPETDALPEGAENEGDAHTHGNDEIEKFASFGEEDADNKPSSADVDNAKKNGKPSYVITPNGSVIKIDPKTGIAKVISTDVPSDPNSPTRKNNIAPSIDPYIPDNRENNDRNKSITNEKNDRNENNTDKKQNQNNE